MLLDELSEKLEWVGFGFWRDLRFVPLDNVAQKFEVVFLVSGEPFLIVVEGRDDLASFPVSRLIVNGAGFKRVRERAIIQRNLRAGIFAKAFHRSRI